MAKNGKQLALDLAPRGGALVRVGRAVALSPQARRLAARIANAAIEKFGRRAARKSRPKKKGQKKMAMPAALARWHRQHGGHSKRRKSTSSRSIVVRRSAPIVKVVRVGGGTTHHKKKHHRRGGGASLGHIPRNRKAWLAAHGGLIGYTQNVKKMELWDKIPTLGKVPKEIILAAALEAFGLTRKHRQLDNFATAAAVVGGYKAGEEGFAILGDED